VGRAQGSKINYRYSDADFLVLHDISDSLRLEQTPILDFIDDVLFLEQTQKHTLEALGEVYFEPLETLSEKGREFPSKKELESLFFFSLFNLLRFTSVSDSLVS